MGRHMLFAHTSWKAIAEKQVQSLIFKSFTRAENTFPEGYDHKHSGYLLSDLLQEGVKSAKYVKKIYKPINFISKNY